MSAECADSSLRDCFFYGEIPVCPLVIAVTGHQNELSEAIEESEKKQVDKIFRGLGKAWRSLQKVPHNNLTPAPILVLCKKNFNLYSLVKDVIQTIQKEHPELNYKLIAVTSGESAKEETEKDYDYQVQIQEEQIGQYLVTNSFYLLDINTDNNESSNNIVSMKLNGVESEDVIPIQLDSCVASNLGFNKTQPVGEILQLKTDSGNAVSLYLLTPMDKKGVKIPNIEKFFSLSTLNIFRKRLSFEKTAILNRDSCRFYPLQDQYQSKIYLFDNKENLSKIQASSLFINDLVNYYSNLDTLALKFQKKFRRYIYLYMFFLTLFFLMYSFMTNCTHLSDPFFRRYLFVYYLSLVSILSIF